MKKVFTDYSSSSEDDEYSDPLEVAASAGARLSTPEKASISRKRKCRLIKLKRREMCVDQSIQMCPRGIE